MDAARQVLRFSIPGSVTLLLLGGYLVLGRLLQGDSWDAVGEALRDNVSAAVAIIAAIPIGFVIYQAYYATYMAVVWPWRPRPWRDRERWVRIDRGAQILALLPLDQRSRIESLFGAELELDPVLDAEVSWLGRRAHAYRLKAEYIDRAPNPLQRYRERWQQNWNIVRALVEIGDGSSISGSIKSEYTTLSDIYHALGGCRAGVQLAWVLSAIASLAYAIDGQSVSQSILTMAATMAVTLLLFWVFHRARGHTWVSAQESLKFGLTALFKRHPELLAPVPRHPATS